MIPTAFTQEGIDGLNSVLQRCLKLAEDFMRVDRTANSIAEGLALGSCMRFIQIQKAITLLAPWKLGYEIGALSRTAAEFAITIAWVGRDDARATEFFDLYVFEGAKAVRLLQVHGVKFDAAKVVDHLADVADARQRLGLSEGAKDPGVNVFNMASGAPKDLIATDFYDLYYRALSMSAHATPASIAGAITGRVIDGIGGALYMAAFTAITWLKAIARAWPVADQLDTEADVLAGEVAQIIKTHGRPGALGPW